MNGTTPILSRTLNIRLIYEKKKRKADTGPTQPDQQLFVRIMKI